ncbi:MAG: UPF0104 family protein, partial [Alphaproteobacteria bacterium]
GLAGAIAATGWEETVQALSHLGPREVAILLLMSLANYAMRGLRWQLLTQALNVPYRFGRDILHYLGGFALTATPGRVGELVRLRWLTRETGWPIERTAPAALADRASELAAVAVLLALAVGLSTLGMGFVWPLIGISLALAYITTNARLLRWGVTFLHRLVGRWGRLFARLRRLSEGLAPLTRGGIALPALLLGMGGWFMEGTALYLLLGWLGADVTLWTAVAIFLAAMTSGALAGLPGGLGGAEATMIGLLLLAGVPMEIALPATAVIRVTTLWFAIVIGLGVFPLAEARSRRALREQA